MFWVFIFQYSFFVFFSSIIKKNSIMCNNPIAWNESKLITIRNSVYNHHQLPSNWLLLLSSFYIRRRFNTINNSIMLKYNNFFAKFNCIRIIELNISNFCYHKEHSWNITYIYWNFLQHSKSSPNWHRLSKCIPIYIMHSKSYVWLSQYDFYRRSKVLSN
jgi:hypothetical protein